MRSCFPGQGPSSGSAVAEWERLALSAGGRGTDEKAPELLRELVAFELGGASYAIPVERVREIIRLREITPMPRVPECVTGVVALRGEIVQVVDLRMRLGVDMLDSTRRSRIIVLHGDDGRVTGVVVDAVQGVLRVSEDEVCEAAANQGGAVAELCRRGDDFVSIVDMDHVLDLDAS